MPVTRLVQRAGHPTTLRARDGFERGRPPLRDCRDRERSATGNAARTSSMTSSLPRLVQLALDPVAEQRAERLSVSHAVDNPARPARSAGHQVHAEGLLVGVRVEAGAQNRGRRRVVQRRREHVGVLLPDLHVREAGRRRSAESARARGLQRFDPAEPADVAAAGPHGAQLSQPARRERRDPRVEPMREQIERLGSQQRQFVGRNASRAPSGAGSAARRAAARTHPGRGMPSGRNRLVPLAELAVCRRAHTACSW